MPKVIDPEAGLDDITFDPAYVEEPKDLDAPEETSLGDTVQKKADAREKTAPTRVPKAETVKKEEAKPAVTPVGDVLDAALAKKPDAVKPEVQADPAEEFKDATEGVKSDVVKDRIVKLKTKLSDVWKERESIAKERDELKGKVRPALEDPEVKKMLEQKDAELAEYKKSIIGLDIRLDPEFRREFVDGRNAMVQRAALKAKSYGGNSDAIISALSLPEGKARDMAILEALENVDEAGKSKIQSQVLEIEKLDDRANEKLSNSQQTFQELEQRRSQQKYEANQQREKTIKAEFDNVVSVLSEKSNLVREFDPSVPGATEWNATVKGARERGLVHVMGGNGSTLPKAIEVSIKGELFDDVEKMLLSERERRIK